MKSASNPQAPYSNEICGMKHTRALYVPDDAPRLIVHEFDTDLGYAATGTWLYVEVSI